MSNPLFTGVKRNGEIIVGVHQRWGAGAWNRVETMCRIIEACTDRNASASDLTGIIEKAIPDAWVTDNESKILEMEDNACDILFVELDRQNTVLGCLEKQCKLSDAGYELTCQGYSGCEIKEELDAIGRAPHAKEWMKENVTRENALDIMRRWDAESSEIWIDGDEVFRAYQEC